MKKIGSSFKKLGGFFLILVLLFLSFKMFSGSREFFTKKCYRDDTVINKKLTLRHIKVYSGDCPIGYKDSI
jgi:hypothetical protein